MKRRLSRLIHDPAGYSGLPLAFKGLLLVGLLTIAAVLVYSTQTMVTELKASEARLANAYAGQWKRAAESTNPVEIGYLFEQIIIKSDFPIIVADQDGHPLYWRGLPGISDADTSSATQKRILSLMAAMSEEYPPVPIVYEGRLLYNLHYGNYRLVSAVRRLPYIGIAVMVLFLLIAYISFRYIKRAEQRYIWVGMAKETAHQLGTPLSSLMGWLEHLAGKTRAGTYRGEGTVAGGLSEVLGAMRDDVERLKSIANRFGQIGSEPDRKVQPVEHIVKEVVAYFRARLPHGGKGVTIEAFYEPVDPIPVNAELVAWVLENLIKNSMQAVDPKTGRITVTTYPHTGGGGVAIAVEDNGSGIPPREQKRIFRPGFTTKKRGWGLGLTLARRIIMEYHNGDIYLETSIPHEVTRLVMHLPG